MIYFLKALSGNEYILPEIITVAEIELKRAVNGSVYTCLNPFFSQIRQAV